MSIDQKKDEFYMTLTPTVTSALSSEEYEKSMRDFDNQLVKPIKLNPDKKWRATLMNAFIPIDLSLVKEANYKKYWFQYIWGEHKHAATIPVFEEKQYFISDGNNIQ